MTHILIQDRLFRHPAPEYTNSPFEVGVLQNKHILYKTSVTLFFFFKLINLFVFIFLAVLGLCCCAWAFGERGLPFVVVRRLLIAVASLVAEHGL